MRHILARSALIGMVGGAAAVPWLAAGTASAATGTVYVSPSGSAGAADYSCSSAGFRSVQAAVDAVPAQGTVVVCAGTYDESVTVTKSLRLAGRPGATIDAAGQSYGVGVAAPYVTVSGLTV
jgi:nitrous oxidase accessory protein NosD